MAGLLLNPQSYEVTLGGEVLELASKEFALLYLLAGHPGRVYSRAYLLEEFWGYEAENHDRTVDTRIYQLHQKINPVSETSRRILALRGTGYKFELE